MRDYRFDVARVACMSFIVAFVHLYAYIYPNVKSAYFIPACAILTDACLGLFTFVSGYLLGKKYVFGKEDNTNVWIFYKKRILRIIPLFVLSAFVLWLIDFNDTKSTLNGLLCISPFVKPRPMTLWYIPVILICYLITPLVSRNSLKWRVCSSILLIGGLILMGIIIPSTDKRLLFNMSFYLGGVISSPYFDWRFNVHKGYIVKVMSVIAFIVLLVVGQKYANFHRLLYERVAAGIGVFAILFLCEYMSKTIFNDIGQKGANKWVNSAKWIVCIVSYASMACYMFHRLFFWMGEGIWNPSMVWMKWIYMLFVVFPIMLVLSYYIQKYYDILIKKL